MKNYLIKDNALMAQLYSIGSISLDPMNLIAGDVNFSGSVNSTDALSIQTYYIGADSTSQNTGNWFFDSPTSQINYFSVISDFYGMIYGDINGSYLPPSLRITQPKLSLNQSGEIYSYNNEIKLPINVDKAMDVGAISLVIDNLPLDCEVLKIEIPGNNDQGLLLYDIFDNQLRIAWSSTVPVSLNTNDPLVILTLNLSYQSCELDLVLNGLESELSNPIGVSMTASLSYPKVLDILAEDPLISIYPNPFKNKTTISYFLEENADIEIVAYDMLGNKFALLENTNKEAGDHKLDWISKDIPSGIYMIVFNMNGDAIISEKVIINK